MTLTLPASSRAAPVALAAVLALSALLLPGADLLAQRRTLVVPAAELTRQAAVHFPQRRCLLGLACLTLADPVIRLQGNDPRIFVQLAAEPQAGGQTLAAGTIEAAGVPRYDGRQGAFYIDAPEILRVAFPGLPASQAEVAAELARGLLVEYFRQTPVWVLDDADAQQALARLALREVAVKNGQLQFTIGDDE